MNSFAKRERWKEHGCAFAFNPFPSFFTPLFPLRPGMRPPGNVNNQERELVSLCDLRLRDTMKGQGNKDTTNIFPPNIYNIK